MTEAGRKEEIATPPCGRLAMTEWLRLPRLLYGRLAITEVGQKDEIATPPCGRLAMTLAWQ